MKRATRSVAQKMHRIETLQDLFLDKLGEIYDMERQIMKALPKMVKKASSQGLKDVLSAHEQETQEQAERIEMIYELLDMKPKRQATEGTKGLLADGKEAMSTKASPEASDTLIAARARAVEHHEMAAYMVAIQWAKMLNLPEAAALMQESLDEEGRADEKLMTHSGGGKLAELSSDYMADMEMDEGEDMADAEDEEER